MSKKIEKLTPEQEAYLPIFRQEYLRRACGGDRIDRPSLELALSDAYACIGKPSPKLLIFDSPAACLLAIKIFEVGTDKILGGQIDGQFWDHLGGQLYNRLRNQIRDQLWDQIGSQIGDQIWGQLRGHLEDHLRDHLRDHLGVHLRGQIWDHLGDQLGVQLWGQLRNQLIDQKIWNPNFLWGSQDNYWIAWAKFGEYIGVKFTLDQSHKLDVMDRIGNQCEWWWPFENIVIACERPLFVKWDDASRLHSESGPAVKYADGYAIYAWHGTRVPANWIENKSSIDPIDVLKSENVEQRAAGMSILGPLMLPALFKQKLAKIIDDSGSTDIGQLVDITLPGLPQSGRYLYAKCPRNGEIMEGVPHISDIDGLPINTAIAAQAWRVGDPQAEYQHPPLRT